MAKHRLTKVQRRILALMANGHHLRQQRGDPPFFVDGGDAVNQRTVRTLQRAGFIKPAADGLFDGFQQSWVLA